jgi:hypothetical protein
MSRSEPKITTPTLSASRFSAMPRTPPRELDHLTGLDIVEAVDAGDTVADGQADLVTSETSASWPKFLIWSLRIAEISAALMSISRPLSHKLLLF